MTRSQKQGLKLAAVLGSSAGDGDRFLTQIARDLAARGLRVGGVVQSNPSRPDQDRCAMMLEELTTASKIPISQNLGRESRGCRLDTGALEHAATLVECSIARGLDIVVLNKFGRREVEGGGFRQAIALAIEADIPVLVGLNHGNIDAWEAFTGSEGTLLPLDTSAVGAWIATQLTAPAV
jgi:nucleoside-triphosphatase THEP1